MENKFAKLSNGLILVKSFMDLPEKTTFQIIGEITKDECSFDCSKYINAWDDMSFEGFKDLIEFETDFRFENPIPKPPIGRDKEYNALDCSVESVIYHEKWHKQIEDWHKAQDKVVEKLIVVKEHE